MEEKILVRKNPVRGAKIRGRTDEEILALRKACFWSQSIFLQNSIKALYQAIEDIDWTNFRNRGLVRTVRKTSTTAKRLNSINNTDGTRMEVPSIPEDSALPDDDRKPHCPESPFNNLQLELGLPRCENIEDKLQWLQSQIVGLNESFISPFGERRITYADHTASGRSLRCIESFILANVLPFYGNTHTCDSYVGQRTTNMVHEAAEYVKTCLGAGQSDSLLFCGSGTTAAVKRLQEVMGIAIPSTIREGLLKSLQVEKRWVVFIGPYEHHSNLLSWRHSLAEVIEIGFDENGLLDMEALRHHLQSYQHSGRPMLGSFSACSNVTGICSDTRTLARLLHTFGAFACFDFAASGPYTRIEMKAGKIDSYDAIFLSPHKFLGGPDSPGVLLMSKALYQLGSSPPSTCGGGTVDFVNGFSDKDTLYFEDIETRENAGTPPIVQTVRAALAFWVKEYIGYDTIEMREQNYTKRALERLLSNPNILALGNTIMKRQAIFSFLIYSTSNSLSSNIEASNSTREEARRMLYLWGETGNKKEKPLPGPFVAKLLNDLFGIQARGGCACAGPYGHHLLNVDEPHSLAFRHAIQKGYAGLKPGWTRVSFPYYMAGEEFEYILSALDFVSIYGQRFLPLYNFNWKTGNWTIKKAALMEKLAGKENAWSLCVPPADIVQELNLNPDNKPKDQKKTSATEYQVIYRYTKYLETAQHIADLLPEFPPQRHIPDSINPDLLHFRV